ncbi:MAG TPA: superoxide dismutase family protein [Mesorhizobium sp.]|jgi:Cu-Zn family superoxide dismutase|nr:superoxide dismutase family protein [Mesorhizobium sp.]
MKRIIATCGALSLAAFAAGFSYAQETEAAADTNSVQADLINAQGETIGTATVIQTPNGVLIRAEASNLPPGAHGFHVHETGQCDAASGFQSAGGHYNPTDAQHGYLVEGGPHAGDMPNQTVGEDGRLVAEVFNPNLSFEGENTLFDDDGSALMIHANADDYQTQAAGDAGDRIACAVIER